jgi:RNA-directed DNA polymerase
MSKHIITKSKMIVDGYVDAAGIGRGCLPYRGRTRKGGWVIAQSPIMGTTITLERLRKRGYEAMLDYYLKVSPQFNEPLYTRPVRTVV